MNNSAGPEQSLRFVHVLGLSAEIRPCLVFNCKEDRAAIISKCNLLSAEVLKKAPSKKVARAQLIKPGSKVPGAIRPYRRGSSFALFSLWPGEEHRFVLFPLQSTHPSVATLD